MKEYAGIHYPWIWAGRDWPVWMGLAGDIMVLVNQRAKKTGRPECVLIVRTERVSLWHRLDNLN